MAAIGLAVVYGILAYVGATSSALGEFSNGGQLLSAVANYMFGTVGMLILGVAVLFACLTTAIGLTTSFGDYFSSAYVKLEYNQVIIAVCVFSFFISNIGLTQLISITLPILLMVYPVLMALVAASFLEKWLQGRKAIYIGVFSWHRAHQHSQRFRSISRQLWLIAGYPQPMAAASAPV